MPSARLARRGRNAHLDDSDGPPRTPRFVFRGGAMPEQLALFTYCDGPLDKRLMRFLQRGVGSGKYEIATLPDDPFRTGHLAPPGTETKRGRCQVCQRLRAARRKKLT